MTFGLKPEWWPGKDIEDIEEGRRWEEKLVHRLQAGNELAGLEKVSVDRASDGVGGSEYMR